MRKIYFKQYLLLCVLLMLTGITYAQTGVITGKVVDETNQPLPGAVVSVQGTTKATPTDVNGNYKLAGVSNGSITIVANFVGYAPIVQQTNVENGSAVVNFKLTPNATNLNEVVVVGYGTTRKQDLTGSISTVTAKDFNQGPATSPEQLIQGKVAGVSITSNSGAPGSGSTITIRGGASVNGSNSPLIVIDGMPLSNDAIGGVASPLDMINPNDIESFTILKDASASAIYGNRASNGVILITTKKGQAGKAVVNFSSNNSVQKLPKEAPVLSAAQFRAYVTANDTTSAKKYISLLGPANTDWQSQIYQTSYATDNNLSISGTAGNLPYRVGAGYYNDNGILKTTSLQRWTGTVNLSPSFFDNHLKLNFNFKGSQVKQRFANEGGVIGGAVTFNPTEPVTSTDPKYAPYGGYWQWTDPSNTTDGLKSLAPLNPVALLNQTQNTSLAYRVITSLGIDYKLHFFPDIHVNVNVGYDANKGSGQTFIPANAASNEGVSQNGTIYSGSTSPYNNNAQNKLFESFLSYNKDFKSIKSHVDAVAGYSIQDYSNTTSNGLYSANGLYYTSIFSGGVVNLNSANNYNNYQYLTNEYILASVYGRLNYSYNDRYYLTGTVRSDNSTKFAPGSRTGTFPSGALGWRVSNEDFMKDAKVVSNLKLRVEYGVTGNQDGIGDYDYLSQYSLSNSTAQYQFGNQYYNLYRPGAYYPGRTWETTNQFNVGFDYGFLNNRITGSIDYFYNKTKNLLVTIQQAAGTNFSNQIVGNVGNMQNHGLELNITGNIIDSKKIGWTANFNVTIQKNQITNLTAQYNPNYAGINVGGVSGGTGSTIQVDAPGYARNTFLVYQQVYGANGVPLDGVYVDRNGDGIINNKDLYQDHSPAPTAFFGFSSDFRYQKWNVGFVARANVGNYVYNNFASNTGIQRNILNPIGTINNGSNDVLTSGLSGNGSNALFSDYYIQNASFIRMDNVHIGYNFGSIFKNTASLAITANVQNVFVITQYKGVDPEVNSGIDNNAYPRPRMYTLGVNLNVK